MTDVAADKKADLFLYPVSTSSQFFKTKYMSRFLLLTLMAFFSFTITQACNKEDGLVTEAENIPNVNTTPAELLETEWLTSKFAVWNSYRIYHNGEFYNPQTQMWYSGRTDAADLDPDGGTGFYFGNKRFVTTIVSSASSGGGCRTNNAFYTEGVPEFKGNKLIFHPTLQRGKSKSVCSPSDDYDKNFQAVKEEFTWAMGTETDPDGYAYYTLTLTDKNNNTSVFYRRK